MKPDYVPKLDVGNRSFQLDTQGKSLEREGAKIQPQKQTALGGENVFLGFIVKIY